MRKVVPGFMLTMLFLSMLTLAADIRRVKCSGTIYIKADGSVDPPSAPIQRNESLYILTGNISDSIVIQKDNIVVDGRGYTLHGTGGSTGFLLQGRNNVMVENTNIDNFDFGISLEAASSNNRICGNLITSSSTSGIRLTDSCVNNNVYGNKITIDTDQGITVSSSSYNRIYENNIIATNWNGIRIYSSSHNNISRNNVTANIVGIALWYSSKYNNIYENNISGNNSHGIFLYRFCARNNIFGNNIIENSMNGINLDSSSNNTIFHNNIIGNAHQVLSFNSTNSWNKSYPDGGNYWSDYTGIDAMYGPNQDKPGSDGIGDTKYVIDVNNSDNYPSMKPFSQCPRGPQMDALHIKYYPDGTAAYDALMTGEADLINRELSWEEADGVFNDASVQAAISPITGIFTFDINNNATTPTYPDWISPTAYRGFRQGIAYLVNKTQIVNDICNFSYRIDTPIPRPNGDWWANLAVSQYDPYGNYLGNYPYEYSSMLAADCFDSAGFMEGTTTNPYYDESFPGSAHYLRKHPETGETLSPLIFYIRNDAGHAGRLQAGRILRDNLRKMGIPVNAIEADKDTCVEEVMRKGDYHIYTGGWSSSFAHDFLRIYSSASVNANPMVNYVQFRNATYDELVSKLADFGLEIARIAALECQRILIEEAASVWLWTRSVVTGYRNIYGVVNGRGNRIDNRWTFLNARVNGTRTEIHYGLQNPPSSLNIATDYDASGVSSIRPSTTSCLDLIYDTLLSYSPYDKTPGFYFGETMPWMAVDWEVEEWQSPYNPAKNLTKLTFFLRNGIKWHDGFELTSADVKFTIEYLKGLGSATRLRWAVVDVHHVVAPNANTVVVYENISDIGTLHYIGMLPILPKHVFENINNVAGYTPGANEGHPAHETLIGSGPWRYVHHNSSMLYLIANRDYFMETPPVAEVDFRYDWEQGCFTVDNMDVTTVAEAFGTQGNGVPPAKWEPGCDVAKGDCKINVFDLIVVAQQFNSSWGRSGRRYLPAYPTQSAIYIEHNNPILVGQNLTAYVMMENITRLSGVQFKLKYDNSKLNCLSLSVNLIFGADTIETKKVINQTEGYIWVSISSKGSPVSGNATLATIVFNATKPSGSMLDLWNTKLLEYGTPGETCQMLVHAAVDKGVLVGVSTPTGTNVKVAPAENVQITFTQTTSTGITTLNATQSPSPELAAALCQEIKTTAAYTGSVTVQFAYDPAQLSFEEEQSMKIWLWSSVPSNWTDITSSVDTLNNIVYGMAPHLSIFGVTSAPSVSGAVLHAGVTTVMTPVSPPSPPPGLTALSYYEIHTTTIFGGPIIVRLAYNDFGIQPEQEIFTRIWRWNTSSVSWNDITSSIDIVNNIICGITPQLSIFGVTSLLPLPGGITALNATFSKHVVGHEYWFSMNFTVKNEGDFTRTVTIIVYGNSTTLAICPIGPLNPNDCRNLFCVWFPADWPKGSYTISVGNDVLDLVVVTLSGDVDGDFDIDIYDVVRICIVYGLKKGDPGYDPDADVTCNDYINIFDVVTATSKYGQKDP